MGGDVNRGFYHRRRAVSAAGYCVLRRVRERFRQCFQSETRLRRGVLIAAAVLYLGSAGAAGFAADAGPLNGRWRLIRSESDQIRQQVIDRLIYVDRSDTRVIETPSGREVIGVHTVRPDRDDVDRLMGLLDQITPLEPLSRIEVGEQRVQLSYADGRTRDLCPDCSGASGVIQSTARDGPQKLVIAAWEGRSLTVETNTNAGISVLESFKLSEDRQYLHVEFTIDANRFPEPVRSSQVYAPVGETPGAD